MGLNNRYIPSHPAGQTCTYALDFSNILPPGVALTGCGIATYLNQTPPIPTGELTVGPVTTEGRRAYARVSGGVAAHDYRLEWVANDSLGNVWPRSTLLLCAQTS